MGKIFVPPPASSGIGFTVDQDSAAARCRDFESLVCDFSFCLGATPAGFLFLFLFWTGFWCCFFLGFEHHLSFCDFCFWFLTGFLYHRPPPEPCKWTGSSKPVPLPRGEIWKSSTLKPSGGYSELRDKSHASFSKAKKLAGVLLRRSCPSTCSSSPHFGSPQKSSNN